jgi:hypothetical protein
MNLKPFSELIRMAGEAKKALSIPFREKIVRAEATIKVAQLEQLSNELEERANKLATADKIDFDQLIDVLDDIEINASRRKQLQIVVDQLFPSTPATAA